MAGDFHLAIMKVVILFGNSYNGDESSCFLRWYLLLFLQTSSAWDFDTLLAGMDRGGQRHWNQIFNGLPRATAQSGAVDDVDASISVFDFHLSILSLEFIAVRVWKQCFLEAQRLGG